MNIANKQNILKLNKKIFIIAWILIDKNHKMIA